MQSFDEPQSSFRTVRGRKALAEVAVAKAPVFN
jgi:hypothetical protein